MIGRRHRDQGDAAAAATPQSFDDFALRLGDLMRGERATMGKSLLDVQRELRIKANYIAAIENCDPSAFDTPGFIAGYVRSYARYLGMDPESAFDQFCVESGFSVAHGMSDRASTIRKPSPDAPLAPPARDPLANPRMPFAAKEDRFLSGIEPGAIGSTLVLLGLIAGIGYGGWSVLQEVQRVQVTPVDQTPLVLSELDPLAEANSPTALAESGVAGSEAGVFTPPGAPRADRMQRPQALDVPVMVSRDGPISTLDPDSTGVFAGAGARTLPRVDESVAPRGQIARQGDAAGGRVSVIAARPAWMRIEDERGQTLFSGILNAGESFDVPAGAVSPRIEVGESGAVYFAVDGTAYGPAGPGGALTADIPLRPAALTARYDPADAAADPDLGPVLARLAPSDRSPGGAADDGAPLDPVAAAIAQAMGTAEPGMPRVTADAPAGVTVVATREVWVRVRSVSGTTLFETVMQPGDTYAVPRTEQAPTIRAGDAGAVYFAVNGQTFGPYGGNGAVVDNLALSADAVSSRLAVADLGSNERLARIVAELRNR